MEWLSGIDTFAHRGALNALGKTIAVLGNGLNKVFPEENIPLMQEIIRSGGAVVSEYPPNVEASSKKFIARNRIVSGLSIGVLVIEAMYRSGTSITARMAKGQNKPIFCLPSNLERKNGVGTNHLIKEGARLVTETEDILSYFKIKKKQSKALKIQIPEEYKTIYEAIDDEPIHIDFICKKLNTKTCDINSILMMMELEGYIKSLPGNYIKKR